MKRLVLAVILLIVISMALSIPVKITSWNIETDVKTLNNLNVSIDYVNKSTNTIIVYVRDENEFSKILSHGFIAEMLPNEARAYASQLWEDTKDSDDPLRAYYSYDEYIQYMQQTALNYPSICSLVQIGTSVQNRPILFMKISDNVNIAEAEPEFKYVSSIHGDEVVGYDLLIKLIGLLTSQYGTNPRITALVNSTEIWISPMINPDGFVLQQRFNASGIDLNRNYPMPNGVQHPDGNNWAQETVLMMNFLESRNFVLSANFHGGALVMNYPWDYTYALAPDDALLQQAALSYSTHNSSMYNSTEFPYGITNGAAWYVITGSYQDWNYGLTSNIDITCEVSNVKWPASSQLDTYWNLNQESLLSYMEFVHRGVKGIVTDTYGNPLEAIIRIAGNDKVVKTDPEVGDYHRLILGGNYSITASATGYISQTDQVLVPTTGTTIKDFTLHPAQQMFFTGYVYNMQGIPVQNATVRIYTDENTPLVYNTSSGGIFFVPSFYEGDYRIAISAANYSDLYQVYPFRVEHGSASFILGEPLFYDSFDNGLTHWTVQTPWDIINQNGNNVLTDSPSGNYSNNHNRSATLTNPISLTDVFNPVLTFKAYYDLESGYDYVYVEISTDGTNWTSLHSFTGVQTIWEDVIISLQNYENQSIRIRFRLRSDTSETADGIYIDDVRISGQPLSTIVYGDVVNNWVIETQDAQAVLDYAVGLDPIPEIDPLPWIPNRITAADLDQDNLITSHDAYLTWAYSWGYIPPALGGNPVVPSAPAVTFSHMDGLLVLTVDPALQLMSFDMKIVSNDVTELTQVVWGDGVESSLISVNYTDMHIGFVKYHCNVFNQLSLGFNAEGLLHITLRMNGVVQSYVVHTTTSTTDDYISTPQFTVSQNYPNPFNPKTSIRFSIPSDDVVTLHIFNTKGQLVNTLVDEHLRKGTYVYDWFGEDKSGVRVTSGLYFYRLSTTKQSRTMKMVLLK